jgi:starch phosphorylase
MADTLRIEITPEIPAALARLPELATNLYFSWDRPTRALFEQLDPTLWRQVRGNPKLMLRCVAQEALDRAAADPAFLARYTDVLGAFDSYIHAPALEDTPLVAYFCAEYGFNQSFPIYSGGLGVLAGDHCKAASDERLNFIAVGLLYGQGYFTQTVDSDGLQHASYREQDPRDLPIEPVRDAAGAFITVKLPIAGRSVHIRLWMARVGRIRVLLLDTNTPENPPADRDITHRLYGGDEAARIRQEMVLGIGGVRALRALGLAPAVWHMNEGHAAFLTLELLREALARGVELPAAIEWIAAQCAFTTHTPVAAGHDAFGRDLLIAHFGDYLRELGVSAETLVSLARGPHAPNVFNMTRLALTGARHVNGVSRLHGIVSSQLLADHWPELRSEENPVGYVTNGVHVPTFLHQKWAEFFDEVAGPEWRERLSDEEYWKVLERVPDRSWWAAGQTVKSDMLVSVRERLRREFERSGQNPVQWRHITRYLDPARPDVLVIGFARRFATYKRAALLLRDRARLARLVNDPDRPVVFLFAGKAHPADLPGQAVLRDIKQAMLSPDLIGRVIFIEDYDIQLARWLVSGCDVWLNNPIAPLEASGTSGIKAAVNGRLNLSVLDGWWAEGFADDNGWGLPPANVQDPERRDQLESQLLLDTIEEEVVPLYYARDEHHCPSRWVRYCKRAMMTVIPRFNMRRVVADYARGIYLPAAAHGARLGAHDAAGARTLADWKARVRRDWHSVVPRLLGALPLAMPHAEALRLRVAVQLGALQPNDIRVEFIARRELPETPHDLPLLASSRPVLANGERRATERGEWSAVLLPTGETEPDGSHVFALDAFAPSCGQFSVAIRAYPWHELLAQPYELGLMRRL